MNEPEPLRCRRRILYAGRVQGVGFRYTAVSAARACRVNGYVRNCVDGTVELLVEGARDRVERLLHSLGQSFPGNIERQTVEELDLPEQFDSFEVRW